ncbi:MAG: radical SAM family heme chaperone HemW [Anaerolineae bacterium]
MTTTPLSLYLHIPFCARKCPYCDFNTYAGLQALFEPLSVALAREISAAGAIRGRPPVHTIFLGGGTPTVLSAGQLARVLDACHQAFTILPGAEITSEANPGTVDRARFADLRSLGVNRLSMGVQSFAADELAFLGRIHSADEAETAFAHARAAGFDNINLDFIFGLPQQQPATWQSTLQRGLALAPEHLSLYSLIVEEGTPLAAWVASGRVPAPDEDLAADLYEMAQAHLAAAGYQQYEISNWARRHPAGGSFQSQHNLTYWRNADYLGFGPGAFSGEQGRRWSNLRSPAEYIRRSDAGQPLLDSEEQATPALAMGETMMVGLRLLEEGVNRAAFQARFGREVSEIYPDILTELAAAGMIEVTPTCVRLTPAAVLIGNRVFARFLPD